jgi:hypothetical protein
MRRHVLHTIDPNDERGVAVVIVALSLFALFGMVVLAVDLGALVVKHRGLVNANDAAAVAAAGSFARNEAEVGADEAPAVTAADRFAGDNVADAEHDSSEAWWTVIPGLPTSGCDPSSCGSVKVRYQAGQSLFFAPVLGLSEEVTAHGTATGIWGPAGAAQPAPIVVHLDWLTDTDPNPDNANCAAPVPNNSAPTECAFWLGARGGDVGDDDNDSISADNSQWRWISLNSNGWDTPRGSGCPDVSSSDLRDWISGSDIPRVKVNPAPAPTFVCASTGNENPADFIEQLRDQIGTFKVFPVNDGQGEHAPPGQVDRDGNPCGRGDQSCTPAQYDIVGFTSLRIDEVIRGDDDGEPGDPHVLCSPPLPRYFAPDPLNNTFNLETEQGENPCPLTGLHHPDQHQDLFPRIRRAQGDKKPFQGGLAPECENVDYCYNAASHVITWEAETAEDTLVDWLYVIPPTPGKCGLHELDRDAVCLVVSWQGYRSGGINPGGGVDFGLRAVRLSA